MNRAIVFVFLAFVLASNAEVLEKAKEAVQNLFTGTTPEPAKATVVSTEASNSTSTAIPTTEASTKETSTTPKPSNSSESAHKESFKVICYYNSLSQNRSESYSLSDVDSALCTHVLYSSITLDPTNFTIQTDSLGEDFEKLKALKSKGVIVMISVGGRADPLESEKFSKMVNNGSLRHEFIESTVRFLRDSKLQGLDVDWEYPACWNGDCSKGRPADKTNFVNLLKELRAAFHFYKFNLSVAVSPLDVIANKAYDAHAIAHHVDWINLMNFDYNNETYEFTAIHSPFGGDAPNTNTTVEYWLSKKVPASKLVLGIPTFGRNFSLAKEDGNGPHSPASMGGPSGFVAYFEICTGLNYQLVEGVGPYAYKGNQWVSFDDVTSIKQKAEYIKKNKLGGGMIWSLDTDDFSGNSCGQGKYPLVNALRQGLGL